MGFTDQLTKPMSDLRVFHLFWIIGGGIVSIFVGAIVTFVFLTNWIDSRVEITARIANENAMQLRDLAVVADGNARLIELIINKQERLEDRLNRED